MWSNIFLFINTLTQSKNHSASPEEKDQQRCRLELEAQCRQKEKAFNRSWLGFVSRISRWACVCILLVVLTEFLGTTPPDQLNSDSLISLIVNCHRALIYNAYRFFDFQPPTLFLCAFSSFFIIEIPRQIIYTREKQIQKGTRN